MRIALVHDYLLQIGGAEMVLKTMADVFKSAPIYTLLYNEKKFSKFITEHKIITSWLQNLPLSVSQYRWYLSFMPAATESYNLNKYDVILSSSSAFAKGVITNPYTLHICYCHTPTRYLWSDTQDYLASLPYNYIIKKKISLLLSDLRIWDQLAAQRVDYFIANSKTVQNRIKKYYQKESDIIYPPVNTRLFTISNNIEKYFLTGGRLVPYKKFDLVIRAFNALRMPLKIFGDGIELKNLQKIAAPNIEFLKGISDQEKIKLYQNAQAFIHPQEEDFGLTVIESMAAGRPVIAYKKGGAGDTIIDGKTGIFLEEQSWEAIADTVVRFDSKKYDPITIQKHAKQFDTSIFKNKIQEYIENKWRQFSNKNN